MTARNNLYLIILLLPISGFCMDISVNAKIAAIDVFNQQLKGDSLLTAITLDSAKTSYSNHNYNLAISQASKTLELSKKFPNSDFYIQSSLILARSNKELYLSSRKQTDFNNTLKYYLKVITTLESDDSKWLLPIVYREYGDFYFSLKLFDLTIKNYEKSFELIKDGYDYSLQKEIIEMLAHLYYQESNYEKAIDYYNVLHHLHNDLFEEINGINVLKTIAQISWEAKDYDQSISTYKTIYNYYLRTVNLEGQVNCLSLIGEVSYEAGNNDQADKSFKNYFSLVKNNPAILKAEKASLRYVRNLVTEGDIYAWSTDNGYWSDYETAIRYYHDAQKHTDFQKHADLASEILHRLGSIYLKQGDNKTSVTFFELSLYYAQKCKNLDLISENHIMLARAFDGIEEWKKAFDHYELHSSYNDSILQIAAIERKKIADKLINNDRENSRVEQTLDQIETQEIQELAVAQKELRNKKLENDLALLRQESSLNKMQIQNRILAEDSVKRNLLLAQEQWANEQYAQKIERLNIERKVKDLQIEDQLRKQELEKQRIKFLEQENNLARSKQAYYMLSIILISSVMVFVLAIYLQKRKANKKLRLQNEKIESQSTKLEQAYKNLELLSTIGRDITSTLIIEEIIETVYENLNTLMNASVLGIGVFESEENCLHFPGVREKNQRLNDINIDLSTENTLASYCFNHQTEINLGNYFESYHKYIKPENKPIPGDGNTTSIVYIPLTIGMKRLGVFTVQSFDDHAYNDYHLNIIRNIAIYTKIALENANVYHQLATQTQNLKTANLSIGKQNKLIEDQNEQLLSINEEKNNLMNILAHDLRNPLATAMSMTELVRYEKTNLSAEQYQASEIIWRGLNRMNNMIGKILDIKAVESQQVNLEYEVINANDIIRPLEKLFLIRADSKMIKMHFTSESEDSFIKVDKHYLIQIMENLISNALKFSPANKNIYINVVDLENHVRISVRDEGPGIPSGEQEKLFKKYQKLSTKPTGGEQSIGLGLSIVKKYVEVMKGRVWCESETGNGTEFFVEFIKEPVSVVSS